MLKRKFNIEDDEIKIKHFNSINNLNELFILINENSSLNWQYKTYNNKTLVMIAYYFYKFETFKFLLNLNPDITIKDESNQTLIDYMLNNTYINNHKYIELVINTIDINLLLSNNSNKNNFYS
jgi:hypothetical protein